MSWWVLFVTIFLISGMVFFLLSKLKICIYGTFNGDEFCGYVDFELYNLRFYKIDLGKNKSNKYSVFKNREKFYKSLKNYNVHLFELNAWLGLDDAALTAVSTGVFYSVISCVYSFFSNYISFKNVNFNIVPDFSQVCFGFDFKCIIDVKVVNIITDVLHVWAHFAHERLITLKRSVLYGWASYK